MTNPTQTQIDKLTTNLTRWDNIVNGSSETTVALDSFTVNTVAYYLDKLTAFDPQGDWTTTTAYALKDIVVQSSVVYMCTVAHTSGTFATDLSNGYWAVYGWDPTSAVTLTDDLTVDTNVLHVDSTNNRVGIGTASPTALLDVVGSSNSNLAIFRTSSYTQCVIGADATSDGLFYLYDATATIGVSLRADSNDSYILNGNFGFGTASPSSGGLGGRVVHISNTGGSASLRVDRSDAAITGTVSLTSGDITNGIFSTGSKPLILYVNSTECSRFDSSGNLALSKKLNFGAGQTATIASGAITATKSYVVLAGEGATTDDLDTISGGTEGDIVVLRTTTGSYTITIKDGTGNLNLNGDFAMDSNKDIITLIYDGSSWDEISRSSNA